MTHKWTFSGDAQHPYGIVAAVLPGAPGRVKGTYAGIEFTGLLTSIRWHSLGSILECHVKFDESFEVNGSMRDGALIEITDPRHAKSYGKKDTIEAE
jgi:hypothetical protein